MLVLSLASFVYQLLTLFPFQENGKEDKENKPEETEVKEPTEVEFS